MAHEKAEIRSLLEDTTFDREISPRDERSNLLISLLKNRAFDKNKSILLSEYPITMEELEPLIKQKRVELISQSPIRIYLTPMGKLVALGELSLREREKKKT